MDIKLSFIQTNANDLHITFKQIKSGVSDHIQSAKEIVAQVSNGVHDRISHLFTIEISLIACVDIDT